MDSIQPQFAVILFVSGLVLSGCGLLYQTRAGKILDHGLFNFLHLRLSQKSAFFCKLWPMGKTPAMIAMLGVLFFSDWPSGFKGALFYGIIAGLERLLKLRVKRQRPFFVLPHVRMFQPEQPNDPSHPSGDAMRIWYLAFIIPAAFGLPLPALFLFCCIAVLVSLGRIALGVHFPLDVIGGMGLGLIGAGLYQLCI